MKNLNPIKLIALFLMLYICGAILYLFIVPDNGGGNFEMIAVSFEWMLIILPFFEILVFLLYKNWVLKNILLSSVILIISVMPLIFLYRSSGVWPWE